MIALVLAGLLGLSFGSFANVFMSRVPEGESLFRPPSRCPHCGQPVRWWDNVPVLSWILLGGRCRDCRWAIPLGYPLTEAAFGILAAGLSWRFGDSPQVWVFQVYFAALLLGACVDWRTQYLYDVITMPLLVLGLALPWFGLGFLPHLWQPWIAAMAMAATLAAVLKVGHWLTGRDALGWGDVKLMAAVAAFLGWLPAVIAVFVASVLAWPLLFLYRRTHGGAWKDLFPFGPALAAASAWVAWDMLGGSPHLAAWFGFPLS